MVYVLLADGFEEIEALCPVDMLRRADVDCKTVSIGGKSVEGAHGVTVTADLCLSGIDAPPQMLVLPGGQPGTNNLNRCMGVHHLIRQTYEAGGLLAAICAAPMILGYSGYLVGKKATVYPDFEKYLIGAVKLDAQVVRDGRIITGRGMGAAVEFGAALIEAMTDRTTADKVLKSIWYRS